MSDVTSSTATSLYVFGAEKESRENRYQQLQLFGYVTEYFHDIPSLISRLSVASEERSAIIIDTAQGRLEDIPGLAQATAKLQKHIPLILCARALTVAEQVRYLRAGIHAILDHDLEMGDLIDALDKQTRIEASKPYRILLVDDSRSMSAMHELILKKAGMITQVLNDPLQILDVIQTFSPELILMDMYMPECTGDELAKVIRQHEQYAGLPIVYLSVENKIDRQLLARKMGGEDFITKPVIPENLVTSVSITVERYRQLSKLMSQDSMTGLLNHKRLEEQLVREVSRANREISPLAFAIIDIDFFKKVNDSYGHQAGDQVIKSLAQLLLQRLRNTDYIGRMGGEEFGIIFPNTPLREVERLVNELRCTFERLRFSSPESEFKCSFSAGVSGFLPGMNSQKLSSAADQALYESKQNGRNQVTLASPG